MTVTITPSIRLMIMLVDVLTCLMIALDMVLLITYTKSTLIKIILRRKGNFQDLLDHVPSTEKTEIFSDPKGI